VNLHDDVTGSVVYYEDGQEDTYSWDVDQEAEDSLNAKIDLVMRLFDETCSAKQNLAIRLKFWSGFTYEEIGFVMRISRQAAHRLVKRGLKRMKDRVDKNPTLYKELFTKPGEESE